MEDLDALLDAPAPRRRHVWRVVLGVWAALVLVALATLMGPHWSTLPEPDREDGLLLEGLASLRAQDGLLAAHVLYSECGCSDRVLEHLLRRGPMAGVDEVILLVGRPGSMAARARARGFRVETVSRRELEARFHIVSAPLLVVLGEDDRVRHLGGYTRRKRGPELIDAEILGELAAGARPAELPLFGCATGVELANELDPMGLRQRRDGEP